MSDVLAEICAHKRGEVGVRQREAEERDRGARKDGACGSEAVVLMGGVGMLGGAALELPYPWIMRNCVTIHGAWMYPPSATVRS